MEVTPATGRPHGGLQVGGHLYVTILPHPGGAVAGLDVVGAVLAGQNLYNGHEAPPNFNAT